MKILKKVLVLALAFTMLIPSVGFAAKSDYGKAKNVILLIPDGMSVEAVTMSRWMTDEKEFTFDSIATGLVKTNNSNTPIADSAPAGTAMATGIKSESPFVGVYPSKAGMPGSENFDSTKAMMPIATIIEAAERSGKSTGIISTSQIQHATPADFSAHNPNRNNYEDLGEQQVYQGMEVVLGGGSKYLSADSRKDGEDLISVIKELGYDYVEDTAAMKSSNAEKLWGMFAPKAMEYDIDRDPKKEPALFEMTEKALQVLSKNNKGFFLMVEGSQPDWAAHANDPVALRSEVVAFDKAVKVAKDFADKNKDTVVVVASDHGTGGLTFGHINISSGYDKEPLDSFTKLIKDAKYTGQKYAANLKEDFSNAKELAKEYYNIDLTDEEEKLIVEAKDKQMAIGHIISDRSLLSWTSAGHVGGDVGLYCYSSSPNAKLLSGTVHNHEIGKYISSILDLDLNKTTEQLYLSARSAFEKVGGKVEFVYNKNTNHELKVVKDNKEVLLPISKNYAFVNGQKVDIGGLIIFNNQSIFVPQGAVDLFK